MIEVRGPMFQGAYAMPEKNAIELRERFLITGDYWDS